MTKEEAKKVIDIISQCDGGCEYCVSSLLKLFIEKFPEHENIAKLAFRETFDKELYNFLDKWHKKTIRDKHHG